MPLGRQLHAPGRSRPRPYRADLQAAAARPADARDAGFRAALPGPLPRRAETGRTWQAFHRTVRNTAGAEAGRGNAEARAVVDPTGIADGFARRACRAGRQTRA